jgi:hypothetical protein
MMTRSNLLGVGVGVLEGMCRRWNDVKETEGENQLARCAITYEGRQVLSI